MKSPFHAALADLSRLAVPMARAARDCPPARKDLHDWVRDVAFLKARVAELDDPGRMLACWPRIRPTDRF